MKCRSVTSVALPAFLIVLVASGFAQVGSAGQSDRALKRSSPAHPNQMAPMSPWARFHVSRHKVASEQETSDETLLSNVFAPDTPQNMSQQPDSQLPEKPGESRCDSPAGTVFNLQPKHGSPDIGFHVPVNSESVDFIPGGGVQGSDLVVEAAVDYRGLFDYFFAPNVNVPYSWGRGFSGYYVHGTGANCSVTFEGGFPKVYYPPTHEFVYGGGLPVVAADATRGRFYAADLRYGDTVAGIGLVSSTAAHLNDPNLCPNGTHLTDAEGHDTISAHCWRNTAYLGATLQEGLATYPDRTYVRADERRSGTGAGDVYVSWTVFDFFNGVSWIELAVCPSGFDSVADCSTPEQISGSDPNTTYSEISVRPDGIVTITYLNFSWPVINGQQTEVLDIRYVSCKPQGAPNSPFCSSPSEVFSEHQPLPTGLSQIPSSMQQFWTYPVHGSRLNGNEYDEFVAWSRCSVDPYFLLGSIALQICPEAEVVMTWSATDQSGNPVGWATPVKVDSRLGNQITPWLSSDTTDNTIDIAYLSSERDHYYHRFQLFRTQIKPGQYHATSTRLISSFPDEPAADPFAQMFLGGTFGGYIGLASRTNGDLSRTYFGFTGQVYRGLFLGKVISNSNNLLSAAGH